MYSMLLNLVEIAYAAGGGGHYEGGIPQSVYWQAANLVLVYGVIFYAGKKFLVPMFKDRLDTYQKAEKEALAAKEASQKLLKEMQERLERVKADEAKAEAKAQEQLDTLKARFSTEVNEISSKMTEDAKRTIDQSLSAAKRELTATMIEKSMNQSKSKLETEVKADDKKMIQDNFASRLQAVD
jgi:F0F1-type ATP synthase membrane subunit b/b'